MAKELLEFFVPSPPALVEQQGLFSCLSMRTDSHRRFPHFAHAILEPERTREKWDLRLRIETSERVTIRETGVL